MNTPIVRIAIDGGPSGGKTAGMAHITSELAQVGIMTLIVPEAATLLILSGITPKAVEMSPFQGAVVRLQISNEAVWMKEAERLQERFGKRVVLLCDRGIVGASAYLPEEGAAEALNDVLFEFDMDIESARTRYAGVIHMVTAAEGAEGFYTLANNAARDESPEQARELDRRSMKAWLGHPHLAVVANVDREGNSVSFDRKIRHALAEVFRILGYPVPLEIEEKYLLKGFDPARLPVAYEAIGIEQTYLVPEEAGAEERVRVRRWIGCSSHFHTIKKPAADGARIEIERLIDAKEYLALLERADPKRRTIKKTRYCFVWNAQYFEADVFEGVHQGLYFLERERTSVNDRTVLPPFIDMVRDVTDDKSYKNSSLAKITV
ncbi:MAG: AAA family ATPase [Candidatus Paceibacterota bacterium]|jgi:CYTH domain-containing protein